MERVSALQRMVEKNPNDARAHLGLAAEYQKQKNWEKVIEHLRTYLGLTEDQGNAWGRLGHALNQVGSRADAIEAYRRGAAQARQHGHPSMAIEFEETVEQLTE
jgi:DNA-binding SARP family transcriptional activator